MLLRRLLTLQEVRPERGEGYTGLLTRLVILWDRWSQLQWLEVASPCLSEIGRCLRMSASMPFVSHGSVVYTPYARLFFFVSATCFFLLFSDGVSGDSSSDSDGGPGFFDGINDNPSEEAFLAASAKKTIAGRTLLGSGAGGEGSGVYSGAADGDGDGDDDAPDASETADLAEEPVSSNGDQTGVASPAAAASRKRKMLDNGSGRGGDEDASARTAIGNGERTAGTSAGASLGEDRAAKRKKSGISQQSTGENQAEEEEEEEDGKGKEAPPANFSRVDPSLPRAELAKRFPLFLEAECRTVEVEAGQMLYLPAGWFHEASDVTRIKFIQFVGPGAA